MDAKDQVTVAAGVGQRRHWGLPRGARAAPLLSPQARKPVAILALACLILVAAIGIPAAHQGQGYAIDKAVDSWVMGLRIPSGTLELISRLGGATATTVLTAVLALYCLAARRLSGALLAVVGVLLASGLTEVVLKPLVHRTITANHYLTYPSGHTTGLFALSTALAVVLLSPSSARPRAAIRIGIVAAAVVVSCVVGMAMIGLDFHYFTDTVGGAAVGTAAVLGVAFLLDVEPIRRRLGRLGR